MNKVRNLLWKNASAFLHYQSSKEIWYWLQYNHSMTKRLKRVCQLQGKKFSIKVVTEGAEYLHQAIDMFCNFSTRFVSTREVIILADDQVLMYAKSILSKNASPLWKKKFRGLQQKPLGEILFTNPNLTRSDFRFAKICRGQKEYDHVADRKNNDDFVWARQSCFTEQEALLVLIEYFSPNLFLLMKGAE